jgi:alcohol dehydrogenase (NADP+)
VRFSRYGAAHEAARKQNWIYVGRNSDLELLKLDGTLVLVGAPPNPIPIAAFNLLLPRHNFTGSAIGGIAETQEMLDLCASGGIMSDIEIVPIQKINEAWDRLLKQDVKYRFVNDMESLKSEVPA